MTFEALESGRTRVNLNVAYEPESWTEKAGDFLNVVHMRMKSDVEHFKEFIEERGGQPTGAWRGEIGADGIDSPSSVGEQHQAVGSSGPSTADPLAPGPEGPKLEGPERR